MRKTIYSLTLIWMLFGSQLYAQDLTMKRIFNEGFAQNSYILMDNTSHEAIVIDPHKDIQVYVDTLASMGAHLKYVTETHIPADYLSGVQDLAYVCKASLALSQEGPTENQYKFDYLPLKNKDYLPFGAFLLQVLHTPGHTEESISFLLYEKRNMSKPLKAFTGDFILVGDVLGPEYTEKEGVTDENITSAARALYNSIEGFKKLPEDLEIWPGHGAGSLLGKTLSNVPFSTLKVEKSANKAMQYSGKEEAFTADVLTSLTVPPSYFENIKRWNREGGKQKLVRNRYELIKEAELPELIRKGVTVIDTRARAVVATGYYPKTMHIELNKGFVHWFTQLIDHRQQVAFVVEPYKQQELTEKLMLIGFENVVGVIYDITNLKKEKITFVHADDLIATAHKENVIALDIRTPHEYLQGHIEGFHNMPLSEIKRQAHKLDKSKPLVIHCRTGARAAIGFSLFEKLGFTNITVYDGGIREWQSLGKKLETPE